MVRANRNGFDHSKFGPCSLTRMRTWPALPIVCCSDRIACVREAELRGTAFPSWSLGTRRRSRPTTDNQRPMANTDRSALMDKIVALCKRRGFIFQSSEIYGGLNGFWDYGPLGVELKRNVRNAWWQDMVGSNDPWTVPAGAPTA